MVPFDNMEECDDKEVEEQMQLEPKVIMQRLEEEKQEQDEEIAKEVDHHQHDAKLMDSFLEEEAEVRQQKERGKITPPHSPHQQRVAGSRSPGAKAKSFARMIRFHLRLEEELGLPEALLLPPSSPSLGALNGRGQQEQEDQSTRSPGGRYGAMLASTPLTVPARGLENNSI